MKIITFVLPVLLVLLQASTCNPTYDCGRQCYTYNNGAITICQTSYADAAQFANSVDSLNRIYGNGVAFFADSVVVNGSSSNAENSIVNQLEKQGYTCNSSN